MINKVKKLVTPNDEELFSIVKNIEGMVDVNDFEKYVDATDEYGEYPRTISFHKLSMIDYDSLFSESTFIDKEKFIAFLKSIPQVLLMNVEKIFFIHNDDELESLWEDSKSPNHTLSINEGVGMFVLLDNTILINVYLIEKLLKEEAKIEEEHVGYFNYLERLNHSIIETLLHELYHSLQYNPLFEEEFDLGEDEAEEFCRQYPKSFILK